MKYHHTNDGSTEPPKLQVYLNLDNLVDLRPDTIWPGLQGLPCLERLAADGFEGVQITDESLPVSGSPIPHCGLDRINLPEEADAIAAKHAARGDQCLTVHAGWGVEDDSEVFRLVESILKASEKHAIPIFIETHRATITQDMWRTVQITKQFPEVRFNGDFSHYYCGQEMVYGGLEMKLDFMRPILERVAFMHGRIASPGCMQVPIDSQADRPVQAHGAIDYFEHFRTIWKAAMAGFLKTAVPGDYLIFAPELLAGTHYYARLFPASDGRMAEESDRYAQALIYKETARGCFLQASRS
ncbi:MAG: hypothetical protein WCH98_15695 [Verrucomicrobiota bacterium]